MVNKETHSTAKYKIGDVVIVQWPVGKNHVEECETEITNIRYTNGIAEYEGIDHSNPDATEGEEEEVSFTEDQIKK